MKIKLSLICLISLSLSACSIVKPWGKVGDYGKSESRAEKQGDDYLAEFPNIIPLAEGGLAPAQFNLGDMRLEGKGVPQDYALAAKWHRKAAEQGFPMAQYRLGQLYAEGKGVEKNEALAVKWFNKAAEAGVTLPQTGAGETGQSLEQAHTETKRQQKTSAHQGGAEAQYKRAAMYFLGNGVPRDLVQAYMWIKLAVHHGDETAIRDRKFIADKMTPEQKDKAMELANKWLRDHGE